MSETLEDVYRANIETKWICDAGTRKNPHALPTTASQKRIKGPHTQIKLALHTLTFMRGRRQTTNELMAITNGQRRATVNSLAKCVDDSTKPSGRRRNARLRLRDFGFTAKADAIERTKRQKQGAIIAKADDFAQNATAAARDNLAASTNGKMVLDARDFNQKPLHSRDPPEDSGCRNGLNIGQNAARFGRHEKGLRRDDLLTVWII
jgi:hypothetical protein